MPCGDKWKNKTMRRVPMGMGHSSAIGHNLRGGHWRGYAEVDTRPYVTYQPGCPSISIPGVYYNFSRGQCGQYYQPETITNSVRACAPTPDRRPGVRDHHEPYWDAYEACCHPCMSGHPCQCGAECGLNAPAGIGQGSAAPRPGPRGGLVPRGSGGLGGNCGGGCNPGLGPNWAQGGCAPSSRPYGLNWGYQRKHTRWPRQQRVGPFPVSQRPYYVGYAIPTYLEPFAGCPTRSNPYWVQNPCPPSRVPPRGLGLTKKPKRLGRKLTFRARRQEPVPAATLLLPHF